MIEAFKLWLEKMGYSESSIRAFTQYVSEYLSYISGDPLSKASARAYSEHLISTPLAYGSKLLRIQAVRRFFDSLGPHVIDPKEALMKIRGNYAFKTVDVEGMFKKTRSAVGIRNQAIISLLFDLILAPREILSLQVSSVQGSYLSVGTRVLELSGRPLQMISLYLDKSRPKLTLYAPDEEALFVSVSGTPLTKLRRVLYISAMAVRRAGILELRSKGGDPRELLSHWINKT